jgi:hypothetical protein
MSVEKIFTHDDLGEVVETASGARCGNHGSARTYHANAASVRECYRISRARDDEQAAEIAAEAAIERHLENAGYDDARAQDAYEAQYGVIGFQEAWDIAGR